MPLSASRSACFHRRVDQRRGRVLVRARLPARGARRAAGVFRRPGTNTPKAAPSEIAAKEVVSAASTFGTIVALQNAEARSMRSPMCEQRLSACAAVAAGAGGTGSGVSLRFVPIVLLVLFATIDRQDFCMCFATVQLAA